MMKIYLAGPMNSWRNYVRTLVEADEDGLGECVEIFDPLAYESDTDMVGDYFHNDMQALREADVVIVFDTGRSRGTLYEMGYAAALGKVILYVSNTPLLHGFLVAGARLAFSSLPAAVRYLKALVFNGGDTMRAYCDFEYGKEVVDGERN